MSSIIVPTRRPGRPKGSTNPAKCGTLSGYSMHKNKGELADPECLEAKQKYERNRTRPNREYIIKYKLEKGCMDCGYNAHSDALDFDHLGDKKFNIGEGAYSKSLDAIKEEIEKCDVVCANCHRVRTANRRQSEQGE